MAPVDVIATPAPSPYAAIEDLHLGRSSQLVVRLLRYWDGRNLKNNGEFMGIELLLDEKNTVIHEFVDKGLINYYFEPTRCGGEGKDKVKVMDKEKTAMKKKA